MGPRVRIQQKHPRSPRQVWASCWSMNLNQRGAQSSPNEWGHDFHSFVKLPPPPLLSFKAVFNETWGPLLTEHSCDHETLSDPLHLRVSGNDQRVAADPANGPVKQIYTLQHAGPQVQVHTSCRTLQRLDCNHTTVQGEREVWGSRRNFPPPPGGVTVVWRGHNSPTKQRLTRPLQQTPSCLNQYEELIKSASWFSQKQLNNYIFPTSPNCKAHQKWDSNSFLSVPIGLLTMLMLFLVYIFF